MVRAALIAIALLQTIACAGAGGGADSQSAAPSTQPSTKPLATLQIDVVDLRNHKGQLIFGVFKSANGFPNKSGKSVNWQIKQIDADHVVFTAQLSPGK